MNRITPEDINELPEGGMFVFGSNEAGIHAAGAARLAFTTFGARKYLGFGPAGHTFAIPTKDWDIKVLPLDVIGFYVKRFIAFVEQCPVEDVIRFYVTKIGCGLAGYKVEDIAPFFAPLRDDSRVFLPKEFIDIIDEQLKMENDESKKSKSVLG